MEQPMTIETVDRARSTGERWDKLVHTGPDTIGGRYMRKFWQPVYRAIDLPVGEARPVRCMGEDFTLYRGESGTAYGVANRCAHRGTQLSTGWVEDETIRCFYHGWVFDGDGQCVEQPAEPVPFCEKVRVRKYRVEEYLGVLFAYLGEGDPPPLPRFPHAEAYELCHVETRVDPFNFWNSLDNKQDYAHLPFVHGKGGRGDRLKGADLSRLPEKIDVEETDWGYTVRLTYPNGNLNTEHILMPNSYLHLEFGGRPGPSTPANGWGDAIRWTVPVDDEHVRDVTVSLAHATPEEIEDFYKRLEAVEEAWRAAGAPDQHELVNEVLAGRMSIAQLAEFQVPNHKTQDNVARLGQGVIADRAHERLGRTDVSLILYRKLWMRELKALEDGTELKQWNCPPGLHATIERAPSQEPVAG
jgi:5,5'-dehydrodivanillate O-demethylase oxygenase subunit